MQFCICASGEVSSVQFKMRKRLQFSFEFITVRSLIMAHNLWDEEQFYILLKIVSRKSDLMNQYLSVFSKMVCGIIKVALGIYLVESGISFQIWICRWIQCLVLEGNALFSLKVTFFRLTTTGRIIFWQNLRNAILARNVSCFPKLSCIYIKLAIWPQIAMLKQLILDLK